ncbi:MAG: peroxiredoxin family protein [Saprospiraceae bacterium]
MKSLLKPINASIAIALLISIGLIAKYIYQSPKYIAGDIANEFSTKLIDGSDFKLSDLKGKYVILDFWGSWCGPCRSSNEDLVRIYKKFKNAKFREADGLEIVSVGIEKDRKSWENAIAQDQLSWKYHTSTVENFDSPIAKQYGVHEIPTSYLLNQDGIIMGVNYDYENLNRILSARLIQ